MPAGMLGPHAGAPSMTSAETITPAMGTTKGHAQVSAGHLKAFASPLRLSLVLTEVSGPCKQCLGAYPGVILAYRMNGGPTQH